MADSMTALGTIWLLPLMAEKRRSVIVLQSGHRQAIERDGRPFGPVNLEW
jgi:hypothetical protein